MAFILFYSFIQNNCPINSAISTPQYQKMGLKRKILSFRSIFKTLFTIKNIFIRLVRIVYKLFFYLNYRYFLSFEHLNEFLFYEVDLKNKIIFHLFFLSQKELEKYLISKRFSTIIIIVLDEILYSKK